MLNRRSEQRRRNLFGIHPPACTCVDCNRKRRGLPPSPASPKGSGAGSQCLEETQTESDVKEEQGQQAQAASRETATPVHEQEQEPQGELRSDLPTDPVFIESRATNRLCTCTPGNTPCAYCQSGGYTGSQRNTLKRLLTPMLLTLFPMAAIVGIGLLAFWLLGNPTDASSQISVPTPDLEATIEAAVALAVTRAASTRVVPSNGSGPADPSDGQQEVGTAPPPNVSTTPSERLRPFVCAYCDATDVGLGHYVNWEWEPTVSKTGWLNVGVLIDQQANFFGEELASCTANVSLSDDSGAFYGWIISPNRAKQCGVQPGDWVSNSYDDESNSLSLGVQLGAAAATHPGLEVCLWTGGATKNETRPLDCKRVRQP